MKKLLLTLFFLNLLLISKAQEFSSKVWHNGYLITTEQDTIRGKIKYDMETNIVQLIKDNVVKTYSSHNIFYFEIFDTVVKNYRQFYSIPYHVDYNYETPIIFEVLYEGPLSLLSREAIVQETVNSNSAFYSGGSYVRDKISHTFYFLDKQGNITLFSGKRNDLFTIMARKSRQIKEFVKENRLKTDEIRDLIRITAFYNSI